MTSRFQFAATLLALSTVLPLASAQPPMVYSPAAVVEQFFECARTREFAKLSEICTPESLQSARLPGFPKGAGEDVGMLFIASLLYPTDSFSIDAGNLRIEGDTATVPVSKVLRMARDFAVRKVGRQWKIDMLATLPAVTTKLDDPQALLREYGERLKGKRILPQMELLSAETMTMLNQGGLLEQRGEGNFDFIADFLMLLNCPEGTEVKCGEARVTGDTAVVPVVKTVPFSGTLVMRNEGDNGWRIDLMQSAVKSGAFPPEIVEMLRQHAAQTVCANNLKQVLLAVHMYAQDHNGTFPNSERWTDDLLPYAKDEQLFRCPAHPETRCGYALNTRFAGKALAGIENPAGAVLAFESTAGKWNGADGGTSLAENHNGGAMVGFADGHVQWMTLDMAKEALGLTKPEARVMPDPNAFDDYVAAGKLAKDAGGSKEAYQEKTPLETQRAVVATCAPALARLREGFGKEFMNPEVRSFDVPFPQLADFRDLARVLLVEAKLAEREGRLGDAVNSYLDMLRLATDVPRGGPLIHSLVGATIQSIALRDLVVLAPKLDEQTAGGALSRLAALERSAVPFWQTLSEEFRASRVGLLEQGGETVKQLQADAGAPAPAGNVVMQRALMHIEAFYEAAAAEAHKPYYARREVPLPDDPLAKQLLPMVARASLTHAVGDARRLLAVATIALRAYEQRTGKFPPDLKALQAAKLLPSLPADPFHDGQLAYRSTAEGYLLYSFGPDGDDDGGKALEYKDAKGANADGDLLPG